MDANKGDWLVVKSSGDSRPERRGVILAVHEGGRPPFTVRWTDTDHEALVFPGPDAVVVTASAQQEYDRRRNQRAARVQAEIGSHHQLST